MEQFFMIAVNRLADVEQAFSVYKQETQELLETQTKKLEAAEQKITALAEKYNAAVERFNEAVETINAMSERITALEANYDPTIIKQ